MKKDIKNKKESEKIKDPKYLIEMIKTNPSKIFEIVQELEGISNQIISNFFGEGNVLNNRQDLYAKFFEISSKEYQDDIIDFFYGSKFFYPLLYVKIYGMIHGKSIKSELEKLFAFIDKSINELSDIEKNIYELIKISFSKDKEDNIDLFLDENLEKLVFIVNFGSDVGAGKIYNYYYSSIFEIDKNTFELTPDIFKKIIFELKNLSYEIETYLTFSNKINDTFITGVFKDFPYLTIKNNKLKQVYLKAIRNYIKEKIRYKNLYDQILKSSKIHIHKLKNELNSKEDELNEAQLIKMYFFTDDIKYSEYFEIYENFNTDFKIHLIKNIKNILAFEDLVSFQALGYDAWLEEKNKINHLKIQSEKDFIIAFQKIIQSIYDNFYRPILLPMVLSKLSQKIAISKSNFKMLQYVITFGLNDGYYKYDQLNHFFLSLEKILYGNIQQKIKIYFSLWKYTFLLLGLSFIFVYLVTNQIYIIILMGLFFMVYFDEKYVMKQYFKIGGLKHILGFLVVISFVFSGGTNIENINNGLEKITSFFHKTIHNGDEIFSQMMNQNIKGNIFEK